MDEKDFLSWFPTRKKPLKNSYMVLEEVSTLLGFGCDEMKFLFRLLRKMDSGSLNFRFGNLEVLVERSQEHTPKQIEMNLFYEKGSISKMANYDYDLHNLEALFSNKSRSALIKLLD